MTKKTSLSPSVQCWEIAELGGKVWTIKTQSYWEQKVVSHILWWNSTSSTNAVIFSPWCNHQLSVYYNTKSDSITIASMEFYLYFPMALSIATGV